MPAAAAARNFLRFMFAGYSVAREIARVGDRDIPAGCAKIGEVIVMSRIETIEGQIQELSPEELAAFREWFVRFDADVWDRQFEADVAAGKLDDLAERALLEHAAGRSTQL